MNNSVRAVNINCLCIFNTVQCISSNPPNSKRCLAWKQQRERNKPFFQVCMLHPTSHCLPRIPWHQVKAAELKMKPLAFKAAAYFNSVNWGWLCSCMLCVLWRCMCIVLWLIRVNVRLVQLSSKIKREGWVSWRRHQTQKTAKSQPHAPGESLSSYQLHQLAGHVARTEHRTDPHCTSGWSSSRRVLQL